MRARIALIAAQQQVELREVVLRDKPPAFLAASPSTTVPCLETPDGVIDESLDIMRWALARNDPLRWLEMPPEGWDWIARSDGPFKAALDRVKYPDRFPGSDADAARGEAAAFLTDLDRQINGWIFARPSIADHAILPFIRQFAAIDRDWFDRQPWPRLQGWLQGFLASDIFAAAMIRPAAWRPGDAPLIFPTAA